MNTEYVGWWTTLELKENGANGSTDQGGAEESEPWLIFIWDWSIITPVLLDNVGFGIC